MKFAVLLASAIREAIGKKGEEYIAVLQSHDVNSPLEWNVHKGKIEGVKELLKRLGL